MIEKSLEIIYWGLPSLSFLLSLSILVILVLSKKDANIRTFMLMVISMLIWSFSSLMMKMSLFPGTLFWNRMMIAGLMFIPLTAYIFFRFFIGRRKWLPIIFWTIITFGMQILNAMGYTVLAAEMIKIPVAPYVELQYELGFAAYLSYVLIFVLLLTCLGIALKESKRSVTVKTGLKYVVSSLFIIFVGIGANLVPVIGKYPVDFFMGSIAAIFIMRALYSNRILELRFVITKALIFTLLFIGITVGSTLALNSLMNIYTNLNTDLNQKVLIIMATLLSLLIFQPLFKFLYTMVDRIFYKEEKLREDLINTFTGDIANNLNLTSITDGMMNIITQITGASRNFLFLKDRESGKFEFATSSVRLDRSDFSFEPNHAFVRWFDQSSDMIYGRDLDTHPFFKGMWDKDLTTLNEILFEVAVPMKSHNELIGIVLICHKDVRSVREVLHLEQVSLVCTTASIAISNALLYEQARHEAITDSLTATYNRRYFMEKLEQVTQSTKNSMALVLLGIDMFTVYNDIYGHTAGDTALLKVGEKIRRTTGESITVCRYAGDIFALIVPKMDTKQVYDLSEKIRTQIERTSVSTESEPDRFVTVSCGLCVFPTYASNENTLLKNANAALIEAKRSGRNKTIIYNNVVQDNPHKDFELDENQWATIYALTATIDAKDHVTFGHSQRVAKYATAIARAMGANEADIELIRQASLLHDIGKIGIPESVLTKTTRLTQDEYEIMKRHVDLSVTIIKYLPTFNKVIPSVIGHHERYDGNGYPRQLKGDNIPFGARCIALADAFDAITSDRHYKMNMTIDYALQEIRRNSGSQFDPKMADAFIRLIDAGQIIVEPTRSFTQADIESVNRPS